MSPADKVTAGDMLMSLIRTRTVVTISHTYPNTHLHWSGITYDAEDGNMLTDMLKQTGYAGNSAADIEIHQHATSWAPLDVATYRV